MVQNAAPAARTRHFGSETADALRPSCADHIAAATALYLDAGVANTRLVACDAQGDVLLDETVPSGTELTRTFARLGLTQRFGPGRGDAVFVTGKLASLVRDVLGCGQTVLASAAAWMAASRLIRSTEFDAGMRSLALVELSASGYLLVGVDQGGALRDDLLLVNPRCGAGSGINLDRVLQKLGIGREQVDALLAGYCGEPGRGPRDKVPVRADRCGVFGSSATISDKNQGIPLDLALATTLKSEVLKACRKLPSGFDAALLAGRVFRWRFARDCAADFLRAHGVVELRWDPDNTQVLNAMREFAGRVGSRRPGMADPRLVRSPVLAQFPAMGDAKRGLEAQHRYLRLRDPLVSQQVAPEGTPVVLALDVGSTMAKAVLADADGGELRLVHACSNAGDTIETIRQVFSDLERRGWHRLALRGVGITGSARFQAQQALEHVYPELLGRVCVLVENYAHARGSIALAREHLRRLGQLGVSHVNQDFCILVDIGGEDTKVSTIALKEAELFGNAMNLKCSAGTGSLMDTLSAMFGLSDVGAACAEAFSASRGLAINATCAVFLMENARKLQVQGVPRAEILASANWAIVENMARTLWNQLELPGDAVVLLHGQTMLSDPLPVAVAHRLQAYLDAPAYALVPPYPGHRACFGLLHTLRQTAAPGEAVIAPARLLDAKFDRRIIQCRGAACDDPSARCNRSKLTCRDAAGRKLVSFTVGGCSAVNELLARASDLSQSPGHAPVRDSYKELWDFVATRQPRSDDPNRLVIPRSFAVSEWAYLFARIFERLGVPVHVDEVSEHDLLQAQPLFSIDTCAPHMGAVGQYRRLAAREHGLILAPQIEFLPTGNRSLGRTCTLNQGGVAVAMNLARVANPQARFHLFAVDIGRLDAEALRAQLQARLAPVFRHYRLSPSPRQLDAVIAGAIEDHLALRRQLGERAADLAEEALAQRVPVALVAGREYVLNPGLYDSHVRRLLRDKRMTVLPSYALELELNPDYGHLYWRNSHFIVSLLDAVARRELHARLRNPRLREVFRCIEARPELLPVVQVSTFSCGPDSVVQPLIAEIMKRRPFLLIQSDAVLKELAHLENRVNTYVKQMELGLHERLRPDGEPAFDVRALADARLEGPIDKARDVIYFPTMGDNRPLTAVLRGAGYACIDNYRDDHDLHGLVRQGRGAAGDAVCAPLAAVWADLERAEADFARRRAAGDPSVQGRTRLLYFDNQGSGPCRQGQYADVHQLLQYRRRSQSRASHDEAAGCPGSQVADALKLLVAPEGGAYDIGVEQWVLARCHLGAVVQGVLHAMLFTAGAACRDYHEYQRMLADYEALKDATHRAIEAFDGPGSAARRVLRLTEPLPLLQWFAKYFAYGLDATEIRRLLRDFGAAWIRARAPRPEVVCIALTGEVYMRVSQAEEIFRLLLANLGFGRFRLQVTPIWNYLEFCLDYIVEMQRERAERLTAGTAQGGRDSREMREARANMRTARALQFILRRLMAQPLYRAAGLALPASSTGDMHFTRELIPTLRPMSEIAVYAGEVLRELRHGADVVLNVAPSGCMVATMGEALTPAIRVAAARGHGGGNGLGRVQHLFSADGDVDVELLTLSLLKAMGPERYCSAHDA